MDFSLGALWASMGLFARLIVVILAIMSVASLFIAGERILFFRKSRRESMAFAATAADQLSRGELESGFDTIPAAKAGYLGRTILAGVAAYRTGSYENADLTVESVARALERQSQREVQSLKKGLSVLATVASTAPFVGLLGTVMGIVTAFEMMASSGSGGLGTVSAGIAEALVTTAFGLLVAIPAVMLYNSLQTWTDARSVDLAESANEFLDLVARRVRAVAAQYQAMRVQRHDTNGQFVTASK